MMQAPKTPTVTYDGTLVISTGKSRKETHWKTRDLSWSEPLAKLSQTTIYKIDRWLVAGIRAYTSRPNEAEKQLLIERYGLVWDERKRRYTNSPDNIWQIAKSIYPNKLAEWAITSYGELEYRSKHR